MIAVNRLIRNEVNTVQGFSPELPDKTLEELQAILGREEVSKLSFNESPYGPSPKAMQAIIETVQTVHRYDDAEGKRLRAGLGQLHGFDAQHVFLSNGADEAISLLGQAFLVPGDEVLIASPTFGQYAFVAKLMGAKPVFSPANTDMTVDLTGLAQKVTGKTKLIFICNPNNPTGTLIEGAELEAFLKKMPANLIIVLDEAYAEYVTNPKFVSGKNFLAAYPNVVMVRTFSKIYGLAGLRLGYGIAAPELVEVINRIRLVFNVNMLAQQGALAAIQDTEFIAQVVQENACEREFMTQGLEALGFRVYPSETNFLFVDCGQDGEEICNRLAKQGIIIRSGLGWNLPSHLRISLGNRKQNQLLLESMHKIYLKIE